MTDPKINKGISADCDAKTRSEQSSVPENCVPAGEWWINKHWSHRLAVVALLFCSLMLACVHTGGWRKVPRQGWWQDRGPVVPHDDFPGECDLCHKTGSWHAMREDFEFDHGAETGYLLQGEHRHAHCLRCHNDRGPVTDYSMRGCGGCHVDVHRSQLGEQCEECHGQDDWLARGPIALHGKTRFPLVGAHVATACWRCHPGAEVGDFFNVSTECADCHQEDQQRAQDPDHDIQGWIAQCDRCHIPTLWTGAGFNHGYFPLIGGHDIARCGDCHAVGLFSGLSTACYDCHADAYLGAQDPLHVPAFPTTCEECHDINSWLGADFPHAGVTGDCISCHLADYQGTEDPDHETLDFGTSCENCHDTNSWQGAQFNHAGITGACVICHIDDYTTSSNPNHTAAGIGTSCEDCHSTQSWQASGYFHAFPITSEPHSLDCISCHTLDTYPYFRCIECHAHSEKLMATAHKKIWAFQWIDEYCFACHPTGKAE